MIVKRDQRGNAASLGCRLQLIAILSHRLPGGLQSRLE